MVEEFSFSNLYRHYHACRKNKRGTINALKFELDAENQLYQLSLELQNKSYNPSSASCFVLDKPKLREIIAADFRDRVVHYVLVEHLENIFEPKFIYDSYACRKDKGVHKAVERVQGFIKKLNSQCGTTHYLQLDIKSFFLNINKDILLGLVKKHVSNPDMLWLTDKVINFNVADNYILRGNKDLFAKLPAYKSLIKTSGNSNGLAIGNLTSQFFANLYLNELDQYVKHILKCRHYVRYCDDFLLLGKDTDQLEAFKAKIEVFLQERLGLELNPNYGKIKPVSNGIDFLGYVIRHKYTLIRKRVITNLTEKLASFKQLLVKPVDVNKKCHITDNKVINNTTISKHNPDILEKLRATIASYWGHFIHADSYKLRTSILKKNQWLLEYFEITANVLINTAKGFIPKYKQPKLWNKVANQYKYYADKYKDSIVLFEVGKYIEFYDDIKSSVVDLFKLKPLKANKRGAIYGFPKQRINKYKNILEKAKYSWITVHETGRILCGIKERLPYERATAEYQSNQSSNISLSLS